MRLARIVALWAVAVALTLVERGQRPALETASRTAPATAGPLLDVREADAAVVLVVDGGLRVRLEHGSDGWTVTAPGTPRVPRDLVRAFLDSLFAAVALEVLPEHAEPGDRFGLDEDRRIEIEPREGARRVLVVGADTPTGTAAYVGGRDGAVRVIGRNVLVYRQLLLDAVRPTVEVEPGPDPVARGRLTQPTRPG